WISHPRTNGVCGSSKLVSARKIRLFAWPLSPSKMKLCFERIALTICGTTVSSNPITPGKIAWPSRSLAIKLSRNSSLTRRSRNRASEKSLFLSSPRVDGRFRRVGEEDIGRKYLPYERDYTRAERFAPEHASHECRGSTRRDAAGRVSDPRYRCGLTSSSAHNRSVP